MSDTQDIIITKGSIRSWSVGVLQAQLDTLNKRAVKCNCQPMRLIVGDTFLKVVSEDLFGNPRKVSFTNVEVHGTIPRIQGWYLRATITPATDTHNLVKSAGEQEPLDSKYRTISMQCDHCGYKRRRNDVFVIRHVDTREEKVIGRNCLADFCRTRDIQAMITYASFINVLSGSLDEDYGSDYYWGSSNIRTESLEYFLETTSIMIRRFGWVSRKASDQLFVASTASDVIWWLWTQDVNNQKKEFAAKHNLFIEDHDKKLAADALAWIKTVDLANEKSDYLYNLSVAVAKGFAAYETAGLLASLIPAYLRHMEQEVKRATLRKRAALREYVGEVGKRMRGLKLTVLGATCHDSNWGVSTFVRFSDENENVLVWRASGDVTPDYAIGKTYIVDATPKSHEDHATYGKQTFLTRVTLKKELTASA